MFRGYDWKFVSVRRVFLPGIESTLLELIVQHFVLPKLDPGLPLPAIFPAGLDPARNRSTWILFSVRRTSSRLSPPKCFWNRFSCFCLRMISRFQDFHFRFFLPRWTSLAWSCCSTFCATSWPSSCFRFLCWKLSCRHSSSCHPCLREAWPFDLKQNCSFEFVVAK